MVTFQNVGVIRYHRNNLDNRRLLDEDLAVSEIKAFKNAGGGTIVDVTNVDLARDPAALKRISIKTGLNIIMGAGYYDVSGQNLDVMEKKTEEDIAEEITKDILEGVDGTGIHAGIIGEIGCSWPIKDTEMKALRASGMAQKETNAPLSIHPGRYEDAPLEIIKILKEVGTDLSHTAICHIDRTLFEAENRYKVSESGAYLEYDLWGIEGYYPETFGVAIDILNDTQRIAQIKDLMAKGFGNQILIAHDICYKDRYMYLGGHGYAHILNNALPAMRQRGMSELQINDLLVNNPAQFLAFRK
jgi:phosphotriesterase-related protein